MIIAIDPGTYNSGIAVIEENKIGLFNLSAKDTDIYITQLISDMENIEKIIIGNTKSKENFSRLLSIKPGITTLVDEKNSTMEARQLCLKYYLDKLNLIKAVSIFFNGSHCDDWAALVLYCRYKNIQPDAILKKISFVTGEYLPGLRQNAP